MKLENAISELRKAKQRKFTQTFDLIVNTKNLDLRKPENRFNIEIVLPHGRGKDVKIAVISDSYSGENAIDIEQVREVAKNKRKAKEFVRSYDFFIADVRYMAEIGKLMGRYMGPLNRMPKPLPPNVPVQPIIERLKKTVRAVLKTTPSVQLPVGSEKLEDKQIVENTRAALSAIEKALPKGRNNIKSIYLKLTMSKPVEVDV